MTDERGGRYSREARFFLVGDKIVAQSHILEARSLMGYMRDMHSLGGPPIQVQYVTLKDGTRIIATMMNGQYQAEIVTVTQKRELEELYARSLWFLYPVVISGQEYAFLPNPATGARPTGLTAAGAYAGGFVTVRASASASYVGYTEDGGLAGYPNTKQTLVNADGTDSAVLVGGKFLFYRGAVFSLGSTYMYGMGIVAGHVMLVSEGSWPNVSVYLIPVDVLDSVARTRAYKLTHPFVGGDQQNGTMDGILALTAMPLNIGEYSASILDGTGGAGIFPDTGVHVGGTDRIAVTNSLVSGNSFAVLEVSPGVVQQVQIFPSQSGAVAEYTGTNPPGVRVAGRVDTVEPIGGGSCASTTRIYSNETYSSVSTNYTDTAAETSPVLPEGQQIVVTRQYRLVQNGYESSDLVEDVSRTGYFITPGVWRLTGATIERHTVSERRVNQSLDVETTVSLGGKFSYVASKIYWYSWTHRTSDTLYTNSFSGDIDPAEIGDYDDLNPTASGGRTNTAHLSQYLRVTTLLVWDEAQGVAVTLTVYNGYVGVPSGPIDQPVLQDLVTVRAEITVHFQGRQITVPVYSVPDGTDVYVHDYTTYTPATGTYDLPRGCVTADSDTTSSTDTFEFGLTHTVPSLSVSVMPKASTKWVGGTGYTVASGTLVIGLSAALTEMGGVGTTDYCRFCKVVRVISDVLDVQNAADVLGLSDLASDLRFTEVVYA